MRQRRRAERQYSARPTVQGTVSRSVSERHLQRLLYVGAAVVALAVVVAIALGVYFNVFQPPRKVVAELDGRQYQLREVVPYAVLDGVASRTVSPVQSLNNLIRNDVMALQGLLLGLNVSREMIDAALVTRFELNLDPEADPPATLSQEGQELLDEFLDQLGVSIDDYEAWLTGELWRETLLDHFLDLSPTSAEQIFVEWIVAPDSLQAQGAVDRITEGEEFVDVALELNTERELAEATGIVGWVPQGALPDDIDALLFAEEVEVGVVQGPHATTVGSLVFRITEESAEQPVDEGMRQLLAQDAVQLWMDERSVGLLYYLTGDDVQWVLRQVGVA